MTALGGNLLDQSTQARTIVFAGFCRLSLFANLSRSCCSNYCRIHPWCCVHIFLLTWELSRYQRVTDSKSCLARAPLVSVMMLTKRLSSSNPPSTCFFSSHACPSLFCPKTSIKERIIYSFLCTEAFSIFPWRRK